MEWLWRYNGVDWCGMLLAVLSLFYLGKHRKRGFVLGLACNCCWIIFGIMTKSAGSIIANLVYIGFNIHGWSAWKKDQTPCPSSK
jgi:nicotinamide riboside transporter PnuC